MAAKARAFLKVHFDGAPNEESRAVGLVNFLLTEAAGWQPLELSALKSEGGANLRRLADGSILASGNDSDRDGTRHTFAAL